ncbi:hypothetical protein lerEdw1_013150, partial [Lerista edwardsae]
QMSAAPGSTLIAALDGKPSLVGTSVLSPSAGILAETGSVHDQICAHVLMGSFPPTAALVELSVKVVARTEAGALDQTAVHAFMDSLGPSVREVGDNLI